VWFWGSECVLCVEKFGVCLGEGVLLFWGEFRVGFGELICAVSGRVLSRFMGVSMCCVCYSLWRD